MNFLKRACRLVFFLAFLGAGLLPLSTQANDVSAAAVNCSSFSSISSLFANSSEDLVEGGKTRGILVYLWSPRMVLSVEHAAEVQAVAQSLGLAWLPVYDPRVPVVEIQEALSAAALGAANRLALQGSGALCDQTLLEQGQTLRHFPIAWVYVRGDKGKGWQVAGLPIVSAMPPAFWREAMEQRLALKHGKP